MAPWGAAVFFTLSITAIEAVAGDFRFGNTSASPITGNGTEPPPGRIIIRPVGGVKSNESTPQKIESNPLNSIPPQLKSAINHAGYGFVGGKDVSGAAEARRGSHLKLYKADGDRILLRGESGNNTRPIRTAAARPAVIPRPPSKRYSKRGQTFAYDAPYLNGVDDVPHKYLSNDYLAKDGGGERYYYNDFTSGDGMPRADWRIHDMHDHRHVRIHSAQPLRRPPLPVEKNSCRQYLEFLKYAFDQIDHSDKKYIDDYYYYYDDDYYPGETVFPIRKPPPPPPPPVIRADINLLRKLAYNENQKRYYPKPETVYAGSSYANETVKPATNRRTPEATLTPFTPELGSPTSLVSSFRPPGSVADEATTEPTLSYHGFLSPATDAPRSPSTVPRDPGPIYRDEASVSSTSERPRPVFQGQDGCEDKLFPCPDNLNVTYPVNGYCNRFVVCESGKPHPEFCQEGLHFNLVTKQCDLPHSSFCTYSCPTENGYFGVPGDCGGFFRCKNWYPEYRMCPPRMHWDFKAKICTFEELSSCPLKCEAPYQVKAYSGVCSSYIICTRGVARYHRCPDGMHFEVETLKCVPQNQSNCTDDVDYITRNRGMQNGRKTLCAKVELKEGDSRWCQMTTDGRT